MGMLILWMLLAAVAVYVMVRGAAEEKGQRKKRRIYLKNLYGDFRDNKYSQTGLDQISGYYRRRCDKNKDCIDDITWNDLEMDDVFARVDFTQSSSGAEYLYDMLRRPVSDDEEGRLNAMEAHINYMMRHENDRLDTMMILGELGHTGRYSLVDYLDYIGGLGVRGNKMHYLCMLSLAVSTALIFVRASLGVPLFIGVACYNIATYMKEKSTVAPYVAVFSYIMRMVRCSGGIIKLNYGADMWDYAESLREKRDTLRDFGKKSGTVLKMNVSAGNPVEILSDYIKMLTHIDIIRFNKMLGMVNGHREEITGISEAVGYIDAVVSIGYFRAALPYCCVPVLGLGKHSRFSISEGFHPCVASPVANSFSQYRGMLVTGANASGKSTFLKMAAVNAILAQTIHTCAARSYEGGFFRIYSSMSLRDSLGSGESYYIVEIKALKRIMDAAAADSTRPLLCFVDEVLRGTNTVERIAASAQILEALSKDGVYCFAATHDIELTHMLEGCYDNYHFEEEVRDGDVLFSYRLLGGRAQTRNAIKLLEIMGFSDDIVRKADRKAAEILKNGENKICM